MTASHIIDREKIGVVTDDYAQSIIDVFTNKNKYQQMAERGKEYVKKNLSWNSYGDKMLQVFKSAV
jgi:glycosyltransferase involved in cell wall biosynthesis